MIVAEVSVCIGSETNDDLRRRLKVALRRLGARRVFNWWGLGGSQEIDRQQHDLLGGRLTVEIETYIGITLIGDEAIVERVHAELEA